MEQPAPWRKSRTLSTTGQNCREPEGKLSITALIQKRVTCCFGDEFYCVINTGVKRKDGT